MWLLRSSQFGPVLQSQTPFCPDYVPNLGRLESAKVALEARFSGLTRQNRIPLHKGVSQYESYRLACLLRLVLHIPRFNRAYDP